MDDLDALGTGVDSVVAQSMLLSQHIIDSEPTMPRLLLLIVTILFVGAAHAQSHGKACEYQPKIEGGELHACAEIPQALWGTWTIRRIMPVRSISCWGDEEGKPILNTKLEYGPKFFRWNKRSFDAATATAGVIDAEVFHKENSGFGANDSQVDFGQLTIKAPKALEIVIDGMTFDDAPSQNGQWPGRHIVMKDARTMYFEVCNLYFEATKDSRKR